MSRDNSPVRAYPNGTVKKRSIRVGFQVLARSRFETDPNGTFMQICFLTGGNRVEDWLYSGQYAGTEYHPSGSAYAGAGRG